jgi:Bacterial regulatory helix-turn-helix protein, lysR family
MAIGVIREGSINGVARLIGRPTSSVAMLLNGSKVSWGSRLPCAKIAPSLTLAGEKVRRPSDDLSVHLAAMASLAESMTVSEPDQVLTWTAHHRISLVTLARLNMIFVQGSIRRAARVHGLSQPQLSRLISRLESVFGGSLVQRTATGCQPSERGLRLRDAAHGIEEWLSLLISTEN